jgi:hypothetical protein
VARSQDSVIVSLSSGEESTLLIRRAHKYLHHEAGAVFDHTRKYRYLLWRTWSSKQQPVCFVMLNPSTADAFRTDPTIARCISFARDWGYGGVHIVNLFAFRSTDPAALLRRRDPIGPLNDFFIDHATTNCDRVIAAWGNHGMLRDRHEQFILSGKCDGRLYHFGLTLRGQPRHPLYVARDTAVISGSAL